MATTKIPKWLLILRFAPIIIQLVDDIVIEFKKESPDKQDPLFATKMRAAEFKDQLKPDSGTIPPPL